MFLRPNLYVAGTRSGLRGLGRGGRRSREKLSIRKSQSPLGMALRGRANDATTAGESECEDRNETRYYYRGIKHFMF